MGKRARLAKPSATCEKFKNRVLKMGLHYQKCSLRILLCFCLIAIHVSGIAAASFMADELTVKALLKIPAIRESTPERQAMLLKMRRELKDLRKNIREMRERRELIRNERKKRREVLENAKRDRKRSTTCPRGVDDLKEKCKLKEFAWTRRFVCKVVERLSKSKQICDLLNGRVAMRSSKRERCRSFLRSKIRICIRRNVVPYNTKIFLSQSACRTHKRSFEFLQRVCRRGDHFFEAKNSAMAINKELFGIQSAILPMMAEKKEVEEEVVKLLNLIKVRPSSAPRF